MSPFKKEKIGIFGSGLIGGSWAMIFASVGYQVKERPSIINLRKFEAEPTNSISGENLRYRT